MILSSVVAQVCDMTQYSFLDKWILSLPLELREEFKEDFLRILTGKTHNNKKETLSTAYNEYNDDLGLK